MTIAFGSKHRLADLLMGHATARLHRARPEWADAMANERAFLSADDERLRWSAGCAVASYRAPHTFDWAVYPAALFACVMVVIAYQWSADEGLGTLTVIALTGLLLGMLRPERNLISSVAIGLVVSAVNGFETISGIRPAYEIRAHDLMHDAKWLLFIAPALIACVIGDCVGRKLRSVRAA